MGMVRLFFELFIVYVGYKLIFEFIIPIFNASKQMNKKMSEFQQQMQQNQQAKEQTATFKSTEIKKDIDKEYIDYEEIK